MAIFFFFFTAALLAAFTSHYFLYLSLLRFFTWPTGNKFWLVAGLAVFAGGFIILLILGRFLNAIYLNWLYLIFAGWYGLLVYLLSASAIVLAIGRLAGLAPQSTALRNLAVVFFILAFLAASAGAINARILRVKQQTITIQNLPGAWQDKTIVQISDVHAGAINKNRWLEKMADQINALNPEAIFITGDYFDGTSHDFARLASPLARLRARSGVFFITGNHETYLDTATALDALRASQVRVLDNEIIDLAGLKIIGLSYGQGQTKTLIGLLEQAKTSPAPKILLYHIPRLTAEAKAAGINLQLSGHTHRGQIFPFNLMTRLIYGRYHYGWHQDGAYHLNTSAGTGTWGPPLRTTGAPEITAITLKAQN